MATRLTKALKGKYAVTPELQNYMRDIHELSISKIIELIKECVLYIGECEFKKESYECKFEHLNLIRTNVCPFHKNKDTCLYNIIVLEILKFDTFIDDDTEEINLYTIKFAVCKECMQTFYVVELNFLHTIFIISNIKFIDAVIYYKKLRDEFKLCHDISPIQYILAKSIDKLNGHDCKILKLHKLLE